MLPLGPQGRGLLELKGFKNRLVLDAVVPIRVVSDPDRFDMVDAGAEVAARLCGRSERTLRHLVARRRIPHRRVAGRLQFVKAELEAWLDGSPGLNLEQLRGEEEMRPWAPKNW